VRSPPRIATAAAAAVHSLSLHHVLRLHRRLCRLTHPRVLLQEYLQTR
jgi:hypothetical protein